jgi:Ca-activated chloride channel family protein
MQFLHPEWFNALWMVAFSLVLFAWNDRRKKILLHKFGHEASINRLIGSHSKSRERLKRGFLLSGMVFLVLALAQPQWGEVKKEVRRRGVEVIFLVDTSLSMLAEDVSPSRIEKAKLIMKSFLKELKGDRIGIVTFAGSGFIQSPLTLDYDAFLLFVNSVSVGQIPDAGTSLGAALRTAIKGFPDTKQKYHTIILLSDGEDLEGNVESAIKTAKEAQIRIYSVGLGTQEGAPIPLRSEEGSVGGFKKDRGGNVVITKLNEPLMRQIAEETGGLYFPSNSGDKESEWIYQHMQNIEKKEFKNQMVVEREDHFQSFLFIGLLLIILEMLVGEVKSKPKLYA